MLAKLFNFDEITEEVSQSSAPEILDKQSQIKRVYYNIGIVYLMIAILVWFFSLLSRAYLAVTLVCLLVILYYSIAMWAYYRANVAITKGIVLVLTDKTDPKRYLNIIEEVSGSKSQTRTESYHRRIIHYLNQSISYLMLGDWAQANENIGKIDIDRFNIKRYQPLVSHYYYILALLELLQGQTIDLEAIKEEMMAVATEKDFSDTTKKLKVLEAVSTIENGGVNYYFEAVEADSRLWDLFYQFYRAKNYLLDQKKDKAKQIFEELAQENDDLYFVREAKKYLEEL